VPIGVGPLPPINNQSRMLFAYERPLCADSVEKVENIAATKFTQKRADRRIRLATFLLKHLRRPLVEFAPVEAVPHVPKRKRTSGS
jgi:hypothetical protein